MTLGHLGPVTELDRAGTRTLGSPATESQGHVWIELATAAGHHPLHVAQAVRTALTATRPDSTAITVVITAVNLAA